MHDDHDRCVRAVQGKDARFDGQFITGVTSTGIYCRPSCPARTPAPRNMRFYPSAAAAHRDGFRACKRCQPDATPGSPGWNIRADVVARAVRLIHDGLLDRSDVPTLAAAVGYSPRHLERLMREEVGAGPLGLARAQRAQTARTLVERTDLPFSDVAWAAGFGSIRTFNETIRQVYARAPRELRSRGARRGSPLGDLSREATLVPHRGEATRARERADRCGDGGVSWTAVPLRLPFRPPLQGGQLFGALVATAVPGVEEWTGNSYRRTLRLPRGLGILEVTPPAAGERHIAGSLLLTDLRDLTAAVHRARWLLDLDADPVAVDSVLATDEVLAGAIRRNPGRRVPRTVDPEEMALRLVLGQQVSTRRARDLTGRLVARFGEPVVDPAGGLSRLFPEPSCLLTAGDTALSMEASRRRALRALARALEDGLDLGPGADWLSARESLMRLPGVGSSTVERVAMRALGDPDAFVAGDSDVRSAARSLELTTDPLLLARAERWRPWRAYAVQHLRAFGERATNHLPSAEGVPA